MKPFPWTAVCTLHALLFLFSGDRHYMTLAEQLRSRKKALTVEELAGLLCVGIRTLYKEVEDSRIPFFRVRSSIRFDPHQVADWLETKMPAHSVRTQEQNKSMAGAQAKIV